MERADNLQKLLRGMTRGDFEQKYPHLWLLRELDEEERPPVVHGATDDDVRKTLSAAKRPRRPRPRMSARLRAEPSRYGLYPIAKTEANPWRDRIMVGRASNNDLVLRNESVSKVQAYFQRGRDLVWRIYDAKSANGTRVDGRVAPPGGEGIEVKSGSVLAFGTLHCEVIGSSELYDAL
ncbi:MAG TPA: FHA domain-containing protein [Polyangia bacterium]|nr:FHA domain-containing protein [Polyangia bacterium]